MIPQALKIFVGGYELACAFKSFEPSGEAEQLDATTLCNTGWKTYQPGLSDTTVSFSGIFEYDATLANKIHDVLSTAFKNKADLVVSASFGEFSDTGQAVLFNSHQSNYAIETANAQLIMSNAEMKTDGIGFGRFHYENEINSTSENGGTVDGGAATTAGGLFTYHSVYSATAVGGTVGFELQHSTNGSTWVALTSGALTGFGAGRIVIANGVTIQRYTRVAFNSPSNRNYGAAALARN